MKIIHISLASAFTEGMTYQDNLLSEQMVKDGNEVIIIADCHEFKNGYVLKTEEEDRILSNRIRLIRKKYKNLFGEFISGKIRAVTGLYEILEAEKPDIIFHHSLQTLEMLTVLKYKKINPNVKFYVDSHGDFHNSATNFLSKYILHKIFYKIIIKRSLPYIDKVLCVGYECFDFLREMYVIPDSLMEFYPLGGKIFSYEDRLKKRQKIRKEMNLSIDDILIVHSGKMDTLKRTKEILDAFLVVQDKRLRLILIGSMTESVYKLLKPLIDLDVRIEFLGWKNADRLMEYLCASDLYVQPGGQSATMQNAACCGSALALFPYESHKYLMKETVFYISTSENIKDLFIKISENPKILEKIRQKSFKLAQEKLDYKKLAQRLYQ